MPSFMFLEPRSRQVEFQNNVFDEMQVLQHADADIAHVLEQCKPRIGNSVPHTIVGKVIIDTSDKAHLPQILDTYAAAIEVKNRELRNSGVPIHLSIKTDAQGVVYFVAGYFEPIERMHMKFPYPIDLSHISEPFYEDTLSHTDFAEREELLALVPQIYDMAKQGRLGLANVVIDKDEKGKLFVVPSQSAVQRQMQYGNSMGSRRADLNSEEALEPAQASKIELSEENLKAIRNAMKENYSDMLKEMKKYGVTEAFPATFEECTKLQQLEILSWTLVAPNDQWKNKLGQTYSLTKKGIKSPNEVFASGFGDCDDYALLFYQSAKQLGLLKDASVYVITVDERDSSFKERKKNQKSHDENDQFEDEPVRHANLVVNIGGGSHIFDLTHVPSFRKFGESVEVGNIGINKDLKSRELEILNDGREEGNRITSADYGFYRTPEAYYHYVVGASMSITDKASAERIERELRLSGLKNFDTLRLLGIAQIAQGGEKIATGIATLKTAVKMKPTDYLANYSLGHGLLLAGEYGEAVTYCEKAYNANKKSVENLWVLTLSCYNLAVANYNESLQKKKTRADYSPAEFEQRLMITSKLKKYSKEGYDIAKKSNNALLGDFEQYNAKSIILDSYELNLHGKLDEVDQNGLRRAGATIYNSKENEVFFEIEANLLNQMEREK